MEKNLVVDGVANIPTARWKLKCSFCKLPFKVNGVRSGACIQCSLGKCVCAYHVTCALKNDIPVSLDEQGRVFTLCSSHNPAKKQERKIQKQQELELNLYVGAMVVAKSGAYHYHGQVAELVKDGCMITFEEGE